MNRQAFMYEKVKSVISSTNYGKVLKRRRMTRAQKTQDDTCWIDWRYVLVDKASSIYMS